MAVKIEVEKIGNDEFQVVIIGAAETTSHRVTLKTDDCAQTTGEKAESTEIIRRAIELLLARERPKPIPAECDLTILGQFVAHFDRAKKSAESNI